MSCHLLQFPALGLKGMTQEFQLAHRNKGTLLHGNASGYLLTRVQTLVVV